MTIDDKFEIKYFVKDKEFASRSRRVVPRMGDEVRLREVIYTVTRVVWIEDDLYHPFVAIELERVEL